MDSPTKDTLIIGGHEFTHKPYTRPVKNAFEAKAQELAELHQSGEIDEFEEKYRILPYFADGPHDQITPDDIEGRVFEDFMMAFMPASKRTFAKLIGF